MSASPAAVSAVNQPNKTMSHHHMVGFFRNPFKSLRIKPKRSFLAEIRDLSGLSLLYDYGCVTFPSAVQEYVYSVGRDLR